MSIRNVNGYLVEEYRKWMMMTLTTWGGRQISLLDLYEETKDDGSLLFIGQLPEEWSSFAEHQGADATQPKA